VKTLFDTDEISVELVGGPKDGHAVVIDKAKPFLEFVIRRSIAEQFLGAITFSHRPAFELARYRIHQLTDGNYVGYYEG